MQEAGWKGGSGNRISAGKTLLLFGHKIFDEPGSRGESRGGKKKKKHKGRSSGLRISRRGRTE